MKTQNHNIYILGPRRDIIRFITHLFEQYRRKFTSSKKTPREGNATHLAAVLHPEIQKLQVTEIVELTEQTFLYRLSPAKGQPAVASFRSGAFISVQQPDKEGKLVSRPYSICNTHKNSFESNSYEICIRATEEGFISQGITISWKIGTEVQVSAPQGFFTYEKLRDGHRLLMLAGGSGITPFCSIIPDILTDHPETEISLIQGAANDSDLFFESEFQELQKKYSDRFTYIPVISGATGKSHRTGFIDAAIMDEAMSNREASVYICGPPAMHHYLSGELQKLAIRPKRVRREDYGASGTPSPAQNYAILVRTNGKEIEISADPGETVLVALERAGLNPPSSCRNGSCGFCRSLLIKGSADYDIDHQGLRQADRNMGYFHPCVARPTSDMIIEIPKKAKTGG